MSKRPWFKTRANGMGWTPITWEGWLLMIVLAVAFIAGDLALVAQFGVFHR